MNSQLLQALLLLLLGIWRDLNVDDMFDDTKVAGAAVRSADQVEQTILKARRYASAYAQQAARLTGAPIRKPPVATMVYPRSGVLSTDVWERPAQELRRLLKQRKPLTEAYEAANHRVETLAHTDLHTATMQMQQDVFNASAKITGYRRIIHPELSKSGTCGLCVVAADRVYKKEDLAALHDNCECTVLPVVGAVDPGLALNQDDLRKLYAAGGGTSAQYLKTIRVKTLTNGELGPILVQDGSKVKDESDYDAKWLRPDPKAQRQAWLQQRRQTLQWIDEIEKAISAGSQHTFDLDGNERTASPNKQVLAYQKAHLAYLEKMLRAA